VHGSLAFSISQYQSCIYEKHIMPIKDFLMGSASPQKIITEVNAKLQPILQDLITDKEGAISCKSCGHIISDDKYRVSIDGRHTHMQCNPAGMTFIFSCYSNAPGCTLQGEITKEYSWFTGFNWQLAHCNHCDSHLGWYFSAPKQEAFLGLINDHLRWVSPQVVR